MSTAKNYHPVNLYSVVSKVFEKRVDNGIIDHLEKWGIFIFPVWFYRRGEKCKMCTMLWDLPGENFMINERCLYNDG